jgi:hypothetical protein
VSHACPVCVKSRRASSFTIAPIAGGISSLFPERAELFRELRLNALDEVAVNTKSESGVAVAHALGHGQGVGPQVETGSWRGCGGGHKCGSCRAGRPLAAPVGPRSSHRGPPLSSQCRHNFPRRTLTTLARPLKVRTSTRLTWPNASERDHRHPCWLGITLATACSRLNLGRTLPGLYGEPFRWGMISPLPSCAFIHTPGM